MLARCRLPTVSPKADTITFSAALGIFGECLGKKTPDEHAEEESVNIQRRNYVQHRACNNIDTQYTLTKKLGEGSFAVVHLGEHKNSKSLRCIKQSSYTKGSREHKCALREIEILKTLDHPNIIKIYESMEDANNIYSAMEYCEGGSLKDHMEIALDNEVLFSEAYIARIMKQVVQAVAYLHSRNILHKDLKLDNVMLDKTKLYAKLIDFGLSEQLADSDQQAVEVAGSVAFMPPESITKVAGTSKGSMTLKTDIWALGIMIYIMTTGQYPYSVRKRVGGLSERAQYTKLIAVNAPFPQRVEYNTRSEELHHLVENLLQHYPSQRPSAEECLQHPFFKDVREEIDVAEERTILDTLKYFSNNGQFYAALSNVVQHELHIDNSDPVVKLFKKIDTNDDGELSLEELHNYLNAHGWNTDDVERLLRVADVDGNGYLEISEFVSACSAIGSYNTEHLDRLMELLQ